MENDCMGPTERLGSSFGAAAAAYAEHRPDYAQDAVRWALRPAPGLRVLDLGAGTGKLTAALVAAGGRGAAGGPHPAVPGGVGRGAPGGGALAGGGGAGSPGGGS